jgi:hypothetical protein
MHIVRHYTPDMAEDVFNAVKGFMRHLATRLTEPHRPNKRAGSTRMSQTIKTGGKPRLH